MSGHYLETINIEAVDQYGGTPEQLPDVGQAVVYIARPGEGRAGKAEFPALVMHIEPDGKSLSILVIYDVDDQVVRPNIRQRTEEVEWPAWRWVRSAEPEKFDPSRLNIIRRDLDAARTQLSELSEKLDKTRADIYGEYEAPNQPLITVLVEFEKGLKFLSKRIDKLSSK